MDETTIRVLTRDGVVGGDEACLAPGVEGWRYRLWKRNGGMSRGEGGPSGRESVTTNGKLGEKEEEKDEAEKTPFIDCLLM